MPDKIGTCTATENMNEPFDVDKHRDQHESNIRWQMRREFILANVNAVPINCLLSLSRCFCNIEMMGCTYPAPIMQQIAELAPTSSPVVLALVKEKRKRTTSHYFEQSSQGKICFVQSSDIYQSTEVCEAQADGKFQTIGEMQAFDQGHLASETPEETIHSDSRERKKSKKSKAEKYARASKKMKLEREMKKMEAECQCEMCRITRPGQEILPPHLEKLRGFVLTQPAYQTKGLTPRILQGSAAISKMPLKYVFGVKNGYARCLLHLNGVVVADVLSDNKVNVKEEAAKQAVDMLRIFFWTVLDKRECSRPTGPSFLQQNLNLTSSNIYLADDGALLTTAEYEDVAVGQMLKVIEPEQYITTNDLGVGNSNTDIFVDSVDFVERVTALLQTYIVSPHKNDLVFSPRFTGPENDAIRKLCNRYGLRNKLKWKGGLRCLCVFPDRTAIQSVAYIVGCGGETELFTVVPPAQCNYPWHYSIAESSEPAQSELGSQTLNVRLAVSAPGAGQGDKCDSEKQESKVDGEESKVSDEKEPKMVGENESKVGAEKESKMVGENESKVGAEKESKMVGENESKVGAEKESKMVGVTVSCQRPTTMPSSDVPVQMLCCQQFNCYGTKQTFRPLQSPAKSQQGMQQFHGQERGWYAPFLKTESPSDSSAQKKISKMSPRCSSAAAPSSLPLTGQAIQQFLPGSQLQDNRQQDQSNTHTCTSHFGRSRSQDGRLEKQALQAETEMQQVNIKKIESFCRMDLRGIPRPGQEYLPQCFEKLRGFVLLDRECPRKKALAADRLLNRSAKLSKFSVNYQCGETAGYFRCDVTLKNTWVASGVGTSQQLSKIAAAGNALDFLRKHFWTVVRKPSNSKSNQAAVLAAARTTPPLPDTKFLKISSAGSQPGSVRTTPPLPENRCRKRTRSSPQPLPAASMDMPIPEDNLGRKLLQKLGWTGGGIGKDGTGMQEPLPVQWVRNRAGLGHKNNKKPAPRSKSVSCVNSTRGDGVRVVAGSMDSVPAPRDTTLHAEDDDMDSEDDASMPQNDMNDLKQVITRKDLGLDASSKNKPHPDFEKRVVQMLVNYTASECRMDLVFSNLFTSPERVVIQNVCKSLKLKCKSKGKGEKRCLVVSPDRSGNELVEYILASGGETRLYKAVPPGSCTWQYA